MFKIGDFSKLTFVSIRMLRYYDEIGLFKPIYIDDFTNYRYYSAKQISTLNKIVGLKNLGLKADDIRVIIHEEDNDKQIELLNSKRADLVNQIHDDELKLDKLKRFIEDYNKEERNLRFEAVIKKVPSYKVVTLNAVMENYTDEGALWSKFMGLIGKHNLFPTLLMGGMCYAKFYDEDPSMKEIHIEIGNEVHELKDNIEGLEFKELEPIDVALSVLVAGDYVPNIQDGINFAATWIEENNYEIDGAPRTVYLKGPENEKNPDDYLTEIVLPIKKRG